MDAGADVGCDSQLCAADPLPAGGGTVCASPTATQTCPLEPCWVSCGTPCCFGVGSTSGAITACPDGLVCFRKRAVYPFAATCLPPRSAGVDAGYEGWLEPDAGFGCGAGFVP
jgi:hypothetical protein